MPRETSIQVRVSFEEKERIEQQAAHLGIPASVFMRAAALREHLDSGAQRESLDTARKAIEKDPSNLNVTLEEKGSVVKDEAPAADPGVLLTDDRAEWLRKREIQLKARMSTRAAQIQARKEWDEAHA